jgi:hypothetical protein
MSTAEKIYEIVQRLPAFRQVEILDFASYIEQKAQLEPAIEKPSFQQFVGKLKNSKTFAGDSVDIQRALRDEWS